MQFQGGFGARVKPTSLRQYGVNCEVSVLKHEKALCCVSQPTNAWSTNHLSLFSL